jgi:hypothetical protein
MPIFKVVDLLENTQSMHRAQTRWRNKNWKDSLKNHSDEIEDLLSIIALYDFWKNRLPKNSATKSLFKEIYSDAYMSIHLSCFGLYKNAYMSLRSEFETAMRLIYFSTHPLEFELWQNGNEKWITDLHRSSDVWGQNFKYFAYIPKFVQLEESLPGNLRLVIKNENPKLREVYSTLSKHVHSGGPFLQTKLRLSPKYNETEFKSWHEMFKNIQKYVNILLVTCFSDQFVAMPSQEREQVLNLAIGPYYINQVKNVCGLL